MLRLSNARIQHGLLLGAVLMVILPAANAQETTTPGQAMATFQRVDRWVRAWDIAQEPGEDSASGPYAVAGITIRVDGLVIGRSTQAALVADDQILWRAARQAMHRASTKLPTERDAGWEEDRAAMIERMTLTIELSSALVPIAPSQIGEPGFGYTPGSVGIAVRSGDRVEALTVDSMLMQGVDPTQGARALAIEISGDGTIGMMSADELAEAGYAVYRFGQISITQTNASSGAQFIDRGGRVIASSEINTRSLAHFARGISAHLRIRRWAGIERFGMTGTLDPVTGKHETKTATPTEQALGALALLRYGGLGEEDSHTSARRTGRDILRDLVVIEPSESDFADDAVANAMCLVALAEIDQGVLEASEELVALREQAIGSITNSFTVEGGFSDAIDPGARGLIAWAMVRASAMDLRIDREDAKSAVRAVFREVPASRLPAQMPFLGWAELELAGDGVVPSMVALAEMRQLVWDHMLRPADLQRMDRDLAGGIVFTSSDRPLPSWHGLRPLVFVAGMLGDERFTPGTAVSGRVPSEIGELVQSLRFVRQLSATEPMSHLYAHPASARWGVRAALWDQSMPIESSAMGLMMVTETLRSLDALAARPMPEPEHAKKPVSE